MTYTREDFIQCLNDLRKSLKEEPQKWENTSLEDFLEAMVAYTGAIQQMYINTNQNINADEPNWKVFADILEGAAIYE